LITILIVKGKSGQAGKFVQTAMARAPMRCIPHFTRTIRAMK
jgi:hypothetical protein